MAVFKLPTSTTAPNYDIEVELDGVVFRLDFNFNSRSGFWYFNVLDEQGIIKRAGIKVVNEWDLFLHWVDVESRPEGTILPFPTGLNKAPAGLNELGERVLLTYIGDS